jgi:hypothetical protein
MSLLGLDTTKFFEHKSFVIGVAFVSWVLVAYIVTAVDSGRNPSNEQLSKSKWYQFVSLLLIALYSLIYILERTGRL